MSDAADLINRINAALGEGTVMRGSDPTLDVGLIETGVLGVDDLLGGGIPRGRWTEFYGDWSTLKSYVALKALGSVQREGGVAALVDTEHAYDAAWAEHCGAYPDDLIIQRPSSGEEAVDVLEVLVRQGVDLVVWDSLAATLPEGERDKREAGENANVAELARLMSRAARKLTSANSNRTAIVVINQTRMMIGKTFGNPETTPGGRAVPFYSSHRVAFHKSSKVLEDVVVRVNGEKRSVKRTSKQYVRVELAKSKLTKPHSQTYLLFDHATGHVDNVDYLISWGVEAGLIEVKGAWWTHKQTGLKKQGQEKFRKAVEETTGTKKSVVSHLRERLAESWRESGGDPGPDSRTASAPNGDS